VLRSAAGHHHQPTLDLFDITRGNNGGQRESRGYPFRSAGADWGAERCWRVLVTARESCCELAFWLFRASEAL
jgi:hypothetical protein